MTDTSPLLLTIEEAAQLMGLSITTLRIMVRDHKIASVGATGNGCGQRQIRRIERTEVDAWIKRNRTPAATP